jgi:hypothetical protein
MKRSRSNTQNDQPLDHSRCFGVCEEVQAPFDILFAQIYNVSVSKVCYYLSKKRCDSGNANVRPMSAGVWRTKYFLCFPTHVIYIPKDQTKWYSSKDLILVFKTQGLSSAPTSDVYTWVVDKPFLLSKGSIIYEFHVV